VGVPEPLVTVAVNVTDCPTVLGLTDDVSVVVVANALTTWVNDADEVLPAKAPLPV
jgi:hypothetical protein